MNPLLPLKYIFLPCCLDRAMNRTIFRDNSPHKLFSKLILPPPVPKTIRLKKLNSLSSKFPPKDKLLRSMLLTFVEVDVPVAVVVVVVVVAVKFVCDVVPTLVVVLVVVFVMAAPSEIAEVPASGTPIFNVAIPLGNVKPLLLPVKSKVLIPWALVWSIMDTNPADNSPERLLLERLHSFTMARSFSLRDSGNPPLSLLLDKLMRRHL